MTILRVNAANWGIGTQLTSAQANQIDINTASALDKRSGQVDTLQSIVTATGAGRLVGSYAVGADANTTYLVSGGNSTIDVPTITANRAYTLGVGTAVAGDVIFVILRNPNFVLTVIDGGTSTALASMATGVSTILGESTWGEFLFTGSVWVRAASDGAKQQISWTQTVSGTWVCPPGLYEVRIEGWGGGGGGAIGYAGSTTASYSSTGGGGGGGAVRAMGRLRVVPGASYTVSIGAGGAGATGFADGQDGFDTGFSKPSSSQQFIASGAQGGTGGKLGSVVLFARGGTPNRLNTNGKLSSSGDPFNLTAYPSISSNGGTGLQGVYATATPGVGSIEGGLGGAAGNKGTTAGGYLAGGGGGGGGGGCVDTTALSFYSASSGGAGALGGTSDAVTGTAGANGGIGGANSGAGGGGGGGGGSAGTTTGAGGNGGNGGSGMLIIYGVR